MDGRTDTLALDDAHSSERGLGGRLLCHGERSSVASARRGACVSSRGGRPAGTDGDDHLPAKGAVVAASSSVVVGDRDSLDLRA
jgi:hypothetical protein